MRKLVVYGIVMAFALSCTTIVSANTEGRRTTAQIFTGATIAAAYEKQPIAVAVLAIGAIYSNKRLNDDIENNRRERTDTFNPVSPAPYYYNGGAVVPISYNRSYSNHLSYKGFSYGSSGSNSASFRMVPQQRQPQTKVVYVVVVDNKQNSAPLQSSSGSDACPQNTEPISFSENCSSSQIPVSSKQAYPPSQYEQVAPKKTFFAIRPDYGPVNEQVIPSSYSSSRSMHVSYHGGSYGFSQSNSASFRPAPPPQPQSSVVYYTR